MKTLISLSILAVLLAAAAAPPARAQSLPEIARKERAKRSKEAQKVKVYTNDNIPHATGMAPAEAGPTAATPASPSSPGTSEAAAPPPSPGQRAKEAEAKAQSEAEQEATGKEKAKEEQQAKLKAARTALAQAKEEARLSEDEANLLQMRVTRELDPQAKSQLQSQLDARQADVQQKQEAVKKAQQTLDELEKKFKASGAAE